MDMMTTISDQEIEQAILDNENLVYFVVNKYFPDLRCDEDVVQTGRIGLWKACINYNGAKSKFSTYAVQCILNEIRFELRKRAKMQKFGKIVSLDEPLYFDDEGNAVTFAHLVPDPSDDYCTIDYDLSFLNDKLSERDIKVFKLSVDGFSATEIGQIFGYTRAWASRIIKKARTIAKAKMTYI